MVPKQRLPIVEVVPRENLPSLTYGIDWAKKCVIGQIDGQEALQQAISKLLQTKRFTHLIYSWNYGVEFDQLIGHSQEMVESEIKRMLLEALLVDERITGVRLLACSRITRQILGVRLVVDTVFGEIEEEVVLDV